MSKPILEQDKAAEAKANHICRARAGFSYAYRTLSADHMKQLQEDIDCLKRSGKLSENEIYRSYLSNKKFQVPESFPEAKSIVVMAVFTRMAMVRFHLDGGERDVIIPHQYYDDGLTEEDLRQTLIEEIMGSNECRIERANQLHLKLLAVRSGLGRYGRNNLCYVDGMGSYITLHAFLTDRQFDADHWGEIELMDRCERCRICQKQCPGHCIREENFVIEAGNCVTLYNEIAGEFPEHIPPHAHNALMGCVHCQLACPANQEIPETIMRLTDIDKDETLAILNGTEDEEILRTLSQKLRMFAPENASEFLPILTRNLTALLKALHAL